MGIMASSLVIQFNACACGVAGLSNNAASEIVDISLRISSARSWGVKLHGCVGDADGVSVGAIVVGSGVGGKEGCNVVVSMVGDTVLAIGDKVLIDGSDVIATGDGVLLVGATVFSVGGRLMGARLLGSSVGSKVGKLVGTGVISIGTGVVATGTGVVAIGGVVMSIGAGDKTVMPIVGTSVLTMGGVVAGVTTTGGSVAGTVVIGDAVVGAGSIGAGVVGGVDGLGGGRGGYDMSIFNVRVQNVTSSIVISSSLVALVLYCCSMPLP